jgi:hypothetical protein
MTRYLDVIAQPPQPHKPARQLPAGQYGRQWFGQASLGGRPQPVAKPIARPAPAPQRRGAFIDMPVRRSPAARPALPAKSHPPSAASTPGLRTMDMVVRHPQMPEVPHSPVPVSLQSAHPAVAVPETANLAPAVQPRRRWVEYAQWALILPAAVLVGLAVQSLTYGELAIAAYGLFALVRRVDSRRTFALALIALCAVALSLVFGRGNVMASNFAVYAFLLLLVGAVQLGVEQVIEARNN